MRDCQHFLELIHAIVMSMVIGMLVAGFIVLVVCIGFMIQGPPYTASDDDSIEKMLTIIKPYKPRRILDMGSGNGKLMIRLAEAGYRVDGIELNPVLVVWSQLAIKRRGLSDKAHVRWGNFWSCNVSHYDLVAIYVIQRNMPKLEQKLRTELKPGANVVSNYATFPHLKPTKQSGRARIYEF